MSELFKIPILTIFFLLICISNVYGASSEVSVSWFPLIAGTLGGLAFFLYGVDLMSNGMKSSLGENIRIILTKLSKNRFSGLFTGIVVTFITQSTGATAVMLISFVESGLMQFSQTVAVVLGANIGSTITSQVIAFDIAGYAIVPVAVGYLMKIININDKFRDAGTAILGFGLVFYGMKILGESLQPLKDLPQFGQIISSARNPFVGVLVGTIATCIMQSSPMFTGILMVFAKQGLVGIEDSFYLIIGSCIGTSLLIILAAVGTSAAAKRTAAGHVFVKVAGAIVFVWFVPWLTEFLEWFGNKYGIAPERQIANIHTVYNVGAALVFLPFIGTINKFIEKIIPEKQIDETAIPHLRYIDNNVITMPHAAMELAISETSTLINLTGRMFKYSVRSLVLYSPNDDEIKRLNKELLEDLDVKENKVNFIEDEIRKYLLNVGRRDIPDAMTHQIFGLLSVLDQAERISDVINRSIKPLYKKLEMAGITFSIEGLTEITAYATQIINEFSNLKTAIDNRDKSAVSKVLRSTIRISKQSEELRITHIKRLMGESANVVLTHEIHTELIDDLADISAILTIIARNFEKEILNDTTFNNN